MSHKFFWRIVGLALIVLFYMYKPLYTYYKEKVSTSPYRYTPDLDVEERFQVRLKVITILVSIQCLVTVIAYYFYYDYEI